MAKQLPKHLTHKAALAILPPSSIISPIEAVRRIHDRHFERWPPHINLLYPFLARETEGIQSHLHAESNDAFSPPSKDDIHLRIRRAVKSIKPFDVALSADPAGVFSHTKRSKTVWLGPSTERVQQLQAALQAEFAECNADQRPFTPHLSVGQARSDTGAQNLGEKIKRSIVEFKNGSEENLSATLDWHIDKVYVIERKGFHGRFEVVDSIELDKE